MNYRNIALILCLTACWAMQSCIGCSYKYEKKSWHSTTTSWTWASWDNPLPIKFGDPFLLHASDGKYYMYGTSLEDGFEAYVSDSLSNWEPCGKVYQGGGKDQWNVNCFLAPEVYERDGKYYMFFSANYKENPTNEGENFKIGVAVSDSPTGPFKDLYDRPIFNPDYPIIDANVYFDDETGKCYLYFSRCCYKHSVESEIAAKLKAEGAKLVTVYGIGRMFHIAFWEPHFAAEFDTLEAWKANAYRLGAKLHPLTIEQNAITSFKSRTTLVPCRANTIGPALFLSSDYCIGGCDGALGRGMMWQGMEVWVTLRHGPSKWLPSTFMPTLPGRLFFLKELAGPLVADCN